MAAIDQHELRRTQDWINPFVVYGKMEQNEIRTDRQPKSRHGIRTIFLRRLFDLFCLAWVAPIGILLVLNFHSWVVGAGVGCRLKSRQNNCYIGLLDFGGPAKAEKAAQLDRDDHEILGTLQFVAKALEVWFSIVAASLVYDLTMLLATQSEGLPMAYLLTHLEFGDILTLFKKIFWRNASLFRRRRRRVALSVFVVFVALLCVACNLMGPATAVLVIPTLGWIESAPAGTQRFGEIAASEPPNNPGTAPGCTASSLAAGNFTCASYYSPSLDKLSLTFLIAFQELERSYGSSLGVFQESGLSFTFNTTVGYNGSVVWAPNRQVLREVSKDYDAFESSQGVNTTFQEARAIAAEWGRDLDRELFNAYRNTLDVTLRRQGPSLGVSGGCARANVTEEILSETKSVRCYYFDFSLDGTYNGYYCIRTGPGWNGTTVAKSQFSIDDSGLMSAGNISVGVYLATESINLGGSSLSCVSANEGQESCDWDLMFSSNHGSEMTAVSGDQLFVEYTLPRLQAPNATIVCLDQIYFDTFDYAIDTSPHENLLGLVSLIAPSDLDETKQVIALHPDWLLAAWAIPRSGTADGNRAAASNLVSALKTAAETRPPQTFDPMALNPDPGLGSFALQNHVSFLHALTLVDFTTINATNPPPSEADLAHPLLLVSRSLRVWAYGHTSRTFRFGATVSIFGFLCVIFRLCLSCFIASYRRYSLNFLSAAMRYPNRGEFDGLHRESDFAQISVRVVQRDSGMVEFVPVQNVGGYRPIQGSV